MLSTKPAMAFPRPEDFMPGIALVIPITDTITPASGIIHATMEIKPITSANVAFLEVSCTATGIGCGCAYGVCCPGYADGAACAGFACGIGWPDCATGCCNK